MSGRTEMVLVRGAVTPQQYYADPRARLYVDDAMTRMRLDPADVLLVEVLEHHYRAEVIDDARCRYAFDELPVVHVWCRR